jgi:tyrosine-protein phosphatase YwqE
MIDYEFLYAFSKDVLNLAESIIWVGITNKFGVLLNVEQRQRSSFLTEEEQEEYVSNSITRDKKIRFESKIGKQIYAFGKYKKLSRATIPTINDGYYLLLIFDTRATEFDDVIMKKVVPLIEKERRRFIVIDEASGGR